MADCDEIVRRINKRSSVLFSRIPEEFEKTQDWLKNYTAEIFAKLEEAQSTTKSKTVKRRKLIVDTSSDEDQNTNKTDKEDENIPTTQGKSKRNASKIAEQKINAQANVKLNTKIRRPDTVLDDISNKKLEHPIKNEKQPISPTSETTSQIKSNLENLKTENMPPPTIKPKRGRNKIKKEVEVSDTKRPVKSTRSMSAASTSSNPRSRRDDSDVIVHEVPIPVVLITDSDTDVDGNAEDSAHKDTSFDSDDEQPLKHRTLKTKPKQKIKNAKVRSKKGKAEVSKTNKNKEDSESVVLQKTPLLNSTHIIINKSPSTLNLTHAIPKENETQTTAINCTVVLEKIKSPVNSATLDCTVVLEKLNETHSLPSHKNSIADKTVVLSKDNESHWKKADVPVPVDNIMTDDDSVIENTPEKKPESIRQGKKTKPMFSPYSNSPVKKRVAAFEKLVTNDVADIPTRTTRTKTRNLKNKENEAQALESTSRIPKSKYATPLENRKLPSAIPQTDTKLNRQGTIKNTLPAKSASAVKPSRAEVQLRREEEQKKRLEKEEEVRRKREALMQAKAEEQRKKREEKQVKAQKAREDMEREKEEKLRAIQKEKEDEQLKKNKLLMQQRLAEIEERKMAEMRLREQEKQRKLEEQRKQQQALKPPALPTGDGEDSDSSSSENASAAPPKYEKPAWAQSHNLIRTLVCQSHIPKEFVESVFSMKPTTPDLREIFETVDERILRRNSSAVWRTPPRQSTLPKF